MIERHTSSYGYAAYLIGGMKRTLEKPGVPKTVENTTHSIDAAIETLIRIRRTALFIVICLLIWLLTLILFSLGYNSLFKTYYPYGTILYYFVLADIGTYFSIFAMGAVAVFLSHTKSKLTTATDLTSHVENIKSAAQFTSGAVMPAQQPE